MNNYVTIALIILFSLYLNKKFSEAATKIKTDELARAIFDKYMEEGSPITMDEAVAIAKQAINVVLTPDEKRVMIYADIIMQEGVKQRIDPAAIAAVIHNESSGNTNAKREEYDAGIHYATSYGLMQLLDPTANWLKKMDPSLKYNGAATLHNPANLYDPGVNIEIGTYYLKYQFGIYNRLKYAFAGYVTGTCFVKEIGYVKKCYTGAWGPFVNSRGETNDVGGSAVNDYVTHVSIMVNEYRKIFASKYPEYSSMFPSSAYRM